MNQKQNQVQNALQYKPADAAKLLSMSERKLHDLLQSGEIHSVKIGGSRYIAHETLLNWIKSKHNLFAQALQRANQTHQKLKEIAY